MNSIIGTYQMTVGNHDFLLVDITRSAQLIGIASISGVSHSPYERAPYTELLYVEDEAIINLTRPAKGDEYADKLVHQISTISVCDDNIKTVLASVSDNYFTYSQSMTKSLHPLLELLAEGIYVCHEAKMIPSDGSGNFFWSAYTMRHEVTGTAGYNRNIGKEHNFTPCFLIPTANPSEYSEAKVKAQREKLASGKRIGGVAFHLSGMFSALLDGHHSAVATLLNGGDFNCIVIEPLRNLLHESREQAAQHGREPRITALSCPYVKIPIEEIPPQILENFLMRRNGIRPRFYSELRKKAGKSLRTVGRKTIPREVMLKAELLPDCAAIESACAITELTDKQLEALLAGEIKYDDKIIVSNNYYNSVVTACNFLQYDDFDRFFDFASAIVKNPDLAATHKYIIERLAGITNAKINGLFTELFDKNDLLYESYRNTFEGYIKNYAKYVSDTKQDKDKKAKKLNRAMSLMSNEVSEAGIAQMDAIVKANRGRGG